MEKNKIMRPKKYLPSDNWNVQFCSTNGTVTDECN